MTEKKFVSQYIKKHSETDTKNFPDDFAVLTSTKNIEVPRKTLVPGEEFFGNYEILTTNGESVLQVDNIYKAKYIIYANTNRSGNVLIPKDDSEIKSAVGKYEEYLDWILMDIEEKLKEALPESPNLHALSNEIFMKLNLVRY